MRTTIEQLRILAVLTLLVASAACGSNGSPTAPSSASSSTTASAPTSVVAGATIVGTLSGGSSAAQTHVRTFSLPGVIVTVVGTSVSATVDSGGTFTLTNVPPGQVVLNFSGAGINASVPIGALADNDRVQIGVTVSGTIATLDTLTTTTPTSAAVSMRGVIAGISGACPSLSFSVSGTLVQTSGATVFSAKSCADLVSGDTTGVVGTKRTDGIVLATTVSDATPVTPPPPATPTPPPTPTPPSTPTPPPTVTMNGTIDNFIGTCPSLSMSVSGTYVRTDSATTFTGKNCGDLKKGDSIGVVGTRQSDSTVLATKIVVTASTPTPTPPSTSTVTVTGTLGTFNGPCPTLSMLVGGSYVRTNASTTFSGKSCGDLKSGDVLSITASNTGDNLGLLASKVTVTGSAPVPPPVAVTLHGTISAFSGPCPTLSLMLSGTYTITNAATTFTGKACGDVKIGDTVDVVGTHPADSGTVTATKFTTTVPTTTPPTSSTVTMNGTINGIAGSCPALSMSVSGTYVRTNSATTFSGKSCGELKVGDAIGVAGARQSDSTVLASTVVANR